MENISLSSASKLAFIKWLVVMLCISFSYSHADDSLSPNEKYKIKEVEKNITKQTLEASEGQDFSKWFRNEKIFVTFGLIQTAKEQDYVINELSQSWYSSKFKNLGSGTWFDPLARIASYKKETQSNYNTYYFKVSESAEIDLKLTGKRNYQSENKLTTFCSKKKLDTVLYLLDMDYNLIAFNDDYSDLIFGNSLFTEGHHLDLEGAKKQKRVVKHKKPCRVESGISKYLNKGEYIIIADTYSPIDAEYTLSIGGLKGTFSKLIKKPVTKTISEEWPKATMENWLSDDNPKYTFHIPNQQKVNIRINSGGTPFLYLLDGHGSVISSEATNISKNLNRGNYILIAGNKDDKRGEFTIDLTASSDANLDTKKLEKLEFDEKCLFCPKLKNTLVEIEFHNHKPEFWLKNQAWNEHSQFLSADPEIAVFNKNNQLELKKFGKTIITVLKVNDKNIIGTKTFELNVTKKKQKIEIKKASLIRTFGNFNDFNLTYHTTTPLTLGSQKGFSYQLIYGKDVATVREDGSGYVKKPGEFAVEVTANETRSYKEAKKWFTFHVKKGILALSDSIKQGSDPFEIDKIYNIFDTLFPRYKKYQKFITFKNMSEGIIKFEDKEGNLKFIKPGEARIKYEVTENIFFEATTGFITLNLEKTKVPKVDFEVSYEQGVLKTYSSNLKSFEMTLGNNAPSKIKITPKINKESSDLKIIYKSLDKDIADVSDGGVVSIKSAGSTIIEMYREGDDYFLQSEPSNLHLLFIRSKPIFKFSKPFLTKSYGDDKFENKLITNSSDGNGLTELNYTSSNTDVATVDVNSGFITIVGIGETTIKANGKKNSFYTAAEDSFQLYVLRGLPKITFENKETQKNYGDASFKLNIKKKEGSSSLKFKSLNEAVATVNKEGLVTIVGTGNAKITATSEKNDYFDDARGDFEFKVEKGEQDIELFGFEDNKIDKVYGNPNFTIRVDNKNKHDSWSDPVYEIDNNTVASVSKDGTVKIKGAGQANITVKRKENNWFKEAKKSIVLTVKKAPQKVEFVSKNISKKYGDQNFQVFLKNNISDRDKNVQYSVSNEKIAKVNKEGIVSILGAGNFQIIATKTEDENYSEDKDTLWVSVDKAEIEFEFTTPMIIKNINDEPFNLSDYIKFIDLENYSDKDVKVEFEPDLFEHISIEDGEKATIEKEGFIQIYGKVTHQNFRSDKKFIALYITSSKVSYSPISPKDNETPDGTHHEKETKSEEVDFEPRQDNKHKAIELKPIQLDSKSETELIVDWSNAKNQLESTSYTHATIFYSEQSFSKEHIANYANFAVGEDVKKKSDKHVINNLDPKQTYFVVMVFWNKGQDVVARTAEAKSSIFANKINDDGIEEPEKEKESGKTKKEEVSEDKPLPSPGRLTFLDEEDQLTEEWKKAIEELEKVDFTYGTIEFYYDYYEHKYEHLSLTSFTKGDDLKSLIFDNIFSLRDDPVNSGTIRLFDASGKLVKKFSKLEINSYRQLFRHNRYKIRWDYDGNDSNNRKISLFYTLDKRDGNGLEIANAKDINISKNYFEWDIEAIPEGTYYIYATIDADDKNLVYSEFPITIEHNHGLVMDCSGMYNYPGGEFNAPLRCHKNIIALVNSHGKIERIGKKEHIEDAPFVNFDRTTAISEKVKYQKIYPNSEAFLALTQAANSSNDADKEAVRLTSWGGLNYTGIDKFYRPQKIYSTDNSFTVINQNTTVKNAQEKSRYYIKIMPELSKSIVSKADSSEDQVTFSVHYDVDETDRSLISFVLAMSYNSEKLIWDGVQNNDLLGIASGSDSKNDLNTNPILQWQDSSYGELKFIKDIEKVEREGLEIYDDEDADRMVIFYWMQNFHGQGTFKDVRLGFVGDKQFPVKLLTTTFRLRPGAFATDGDIRVNFGRILPKSEVASWPLKPEHLILKSNSQTDSTPSVSESNSPYITDWRPPYIPGIAKVVSSGEGGYVYDDIKALIANDSINALVRPFESGTTWIKDNIHKEAKTFTHVVSNGKAKAALTTSGEIMTWNKDALTPKKVSGQDRDFIKIYPSRNGFSALKKDGGGVYWDWDWDDNETIEHLESDQYLQVIAFGDSVAGLKEDGTIAVWGENTSGWRPNRSNYKSIYADGSGNLAALFGNGRIEYWQNGDRQHSYKGVEEFGGNHSKIYSNKKAFAALKNDGSVKAWGDTNCGGAGEPSGNDFIAIYSSECSFVAVTKEGKYSSWGEMGEKDGYLYDGKIEIKVEDIEYDPKNKTVTFSLNYTAKDFTGNKQAPYEVAPLDIFAFYDSSKLEWKGVYAESLLGIHEESDIQQKGLVKNITEDEHMYKGELFLLLDMQENKITSYLSNNDQDSYFLTGFSPPLDENNRSKPRLTIDGQLIYKGFVTEKPENLQLFRTSFKLRDGFVPDEISDIRFYVSEPTDGARINSKAYNYYISNNESLYVQASLVEAATTEEKAGAEEKADTGSKSTDHKSDKKDGSPDSDKKTPNPKNANFSDPTKSYVIVTPKPNSFSYASDQKISFSVEYNYSGKDPVTYLIFGMFYSSKQLEKIEKADLHHIFGKDHGGGRYAIHFNKPDLTNLDGDRSTDRYLKIVWSDDLGDNFLGSQQSLPVTLFKANVKPKPSFSGTTTINLVNLPPDNWYEKNDIEFRSTPVTIASAVNNIYPKYAQKWFAKVSKTAPVDQPYRAYIGDIFGVWKNNLTYTLVSDNSQAEKWLSIDPTDASISGTPSIENIGTSEVTITAKDSEGNSVSGSFTLTVFNQTVHVGQKIGGVWKKLQHKDVFDVPFELPIIHDFSDSGDDDYFGVVINYDSKKLKFLGHKNILEPYVDYVKPYDCKFKVSDDTDKCILMNWEVGKLKDIDGSSKVLAFLRFKPTDSQFSDSVIYFTDVINTDVINPETYHGSFRITSRLKDNKSDKKDGSPDSDKESKQENANLTITGPTDKKPPYKVKNKVRKISVKEGAKLSSKVGAPVDFSVTYSADTKDIPNLYLYIYYDSNKLTWNGLEKDSILGLRDPDHINPHKERVDQSWKDTEYGEFGGVVVSRKKKDHPEVYIYDKSKGLIEGDDGSDATDAMFVVRWKRASPNKGTFKSGSTGFVENIPNNLRLFETSFTPKPGFSANEETVVNFIVGSLPKGLDGWDYAIEAPSLTITGPNAGNAKAIQLQYEALSSTELKVYWSGIDQDILDSISYKKGYIYYSKEELEDLDFDDENLADTLKKNGGGKVAIDSGEALISNLQHSKRYYLMMVLRDGQGKFVASSKETDVYVPQYTDKSFKFTSSGKQASSDWVDEKYVINGTFNEELRDKKISFYYAPFQNRKASKEIPGAQDILLSSFDPLIWDTSRVPEGVYSIFAVINGNKQSPIYSPETVTIEHPDLCKDSPGKLLCGKYIKITPKDIKYDEDTRTVSFSVDYDVADGNRLHKDLWLLMHYDSSKLVFNGLKKDSILVTYDGEKPERDLVKKWSGRDSVLSNMVENREAPSFDKDNSTDRIVAVLWGYPSPSERYKNHIGNNKGFIDDLELPAQLYKASFTLKDNVENFSSTDINFTGGSSSKSFVGNKDYSLKSQPVTIIKSANGKVTATVGKASSGATDGTSLDSPYVQITTDSLNIDDDTVEFSVSYDVSNGNERIRSLTLKMFYDSSQLTWNGLEGDSVLGIHPNKQPLTDLIKYWTSRYGEFQIVKDLTEEELEESDNDDSTDRIVYLLWLYNNAPEKRTFSDWAEYKGFLGDEKLPVKLFTASFVRVDESSGRPTRINFKSDSIPSGTMGYGYDFKSQSIDITFD